MTPRQNDVDDLTCALVQFVTRLGFQGGWTLVGRGIGQDVSCWGTDGNCYVGSLSTVYTRDDGSPNPLNGGRTARLSNAVSWLNG